MGTSVQITVLVSRLAILVVIGWNCLVVVLLQSRIRSVFLSRIVGHEFLIFGVSVLALKRFMRLFPNHSVLLLDIVGIGAVFYVTWLVWLIFFQGGP